jgi:hypothetical protein
VRVLLNDVVLVSERKIFIISDISRVVLGRQFRFFQGITCCLTEFFRFIFGERHFESRASESILIDIWKPDFRRLSELHPLSQLCKWWNILSLLWSFSHLCLILSFSLNYITCICHFFVYGSRYNVIKLWLLGRLRKSCLILLLGSFRDCLSRTQFRLFLLLNLMNFPFLFLHF